MLTDRGNVKRCRFRAKEHACSFGYVGSGELSGVLNGDVDWETDPCLQLFAKVSGGDSGWQVFKSTPPKFTREKRGLEINFSI